MADDEDQDKKLKEELPKSIKENEEEIEVKVIT